MESHLAGMLEIVNSLSLNQSEADLSKPYWNSPPSFVSDAGDLNSNVPLFKSMPIHVQKGGVNNMTDGDILKNYSP